MQVFVVMGCHRIGDINTPPGGGCKMLINAVLRPVGGHKHTLFRLTSNYLRLTPHQSRATDSRPGLSWTSFPAGADKGSSDL